jgi:hypothetical protein
MHQPMRVILSVGVVAILLAGAGAGVSSLDWVDMEQFQLQFRGEGRLDAELCVLKQRCNGKEKIIGEMIAGRMTMLEAAACFRQVEHNFPGVGPYPRADWKVSSDEEYFCRQIICFLEARSPAHAKRSERELQELLGQGMLAFPPESETIRRLEGLNP